MKRRLHRVQAVSLGLFLTCLVLAAAGVSAWPADLYFFIDPLLAASAVLATRELLPPALLLAAVLVAATAAFGRFFCGYLCPLGACLDLASPSERSRRLPEWTRHVKTGVLAVMLVAAAAGLGPALAGLLDPLAILWRGVALALYPLTLWSAELGLAALRTATETLWAGSPLAVAVPQRLFAGGVFSFVLLLFVVAANRIAARFWCRVLCPLGALLAVASRWAPFRRRVDPASCLACEICSQACPMGAIAPGGGQVSPSECLLCRSCAAACPNDAIAFGQGAEPAAADVPAVGDAAPAPSGVPRRAVLAAAVGAAALLIHDRTAVAAGARRASQALRPPGCRGEDDFLARCLRCGVCLQACPTNVLQPDVAPAVLAGLMAPHLVMTRGGCDPECNVCGQVCPTGAIPALRLAAKNEAVIGRAIVDREACVRPGEDCRICLEVCPREALTLSGAVLVAAERCNGCGLCELPCPATTDQGLRAIRVVTVAGAAHAAEHEEADPRSDDHLPPFLRGA